MPVPGPSPDSRAGPRRTLPAAVDGSVRAGGLKNFARGWSRANVERSMGYEPYGSRFYRLCEPVDGPDAAA